MRSPGCTIDIVIGRQPFSLDDGAAGRDWALLVLRRKGDRAHFTLEFGQHMRRLVLGVKEFALLPRIGATVTELVGFVSLRDRRQVQDLEAALLLQVACQIVLVHPLHDQNDARRCLVVGHAKAGLSGTTR